MRVSCVIVLTEIRSENNNNYIWEAEMNAHLLSGLTSILNTFTASKQTRITLLLNYPIFSVLSNVA